MDPTTWAPPPEAAREPAPTASAAELAPRIPAAGVIFDDGEPEPFTFRSQDRPSVLTVTSIFAIGRRVLVEVLVPRSASSAVVELAA